MSLYYLTYPLERGFIHNWLVAGPQASEVENPDQFDKTERKLQIAQHYYDAQSGINESPFDRQDIEIDGKSLRWAYTRCREDHLVDLSTFHHTWHYIRAWAYSEVICAAEQTVSMVLTTNGPADVWINGEHVHRQEHFHHQKPHSVTFKAALKKEVNEVLVRFEEVAARECPYAMALQIVEPEGETTVRIPTEMDTPHRWQMFEHLFDQAYVQKNVYYRGKEIPMHWAEDLDEEERQYGYSVQDKRGRIYLGGEAESKLDHVLDAGHPNRLWEGAYYVTLRPPTKEYFTFNVRYQRRIPVHVLDTLFSTEPYGTWTSRRQEALKNAAKREGNVFGEIAKMALAQWDELDLEVIEQTIEGINQRGDCSDFYLCGLLGIMYRYMDNPAFPKALKKQLKACVLGFKYWHDEPGADAMCYTTENHSILFHTCEILGGQLYPTETFSNTGKSGAWHRQKGEELAMGWLRSRGQGGFKEWDSNCYFEEDLLALSHLADLGEAETVAGLAAVMMDKMFFTMALNSFKGVFGSTHGRTYAALIKGGQLESTSGISRLMWGMGVWNQHIRGVVALACSTYELPFIIGDMATSTADEFWNRERHVGTAEEWKASGSLGPEVNKVTYRTPDYMLCSAQDYHPGEKGYQQHIWQATLGPNTVVFANHPPCSSEEGAHRPNFWHGNAVLPRVAQWKDTLIAVHDLPLDDWMGFTHAYFPAPSFDNYVLRDGWAFAQQGDGYLAITASGGMRMVKRGPSAYYELRSEALQSVWVCQMGRRALDGEFEEFQDKVLSQGMQFGTLDIEMTTLRGEQITFGWEGPLTVNGTEEAFTGFKHYENPYCTAELPAQEMDIRFGEYQLKLDFS